MITVHDFRCGATGPVDFIPGDYTIHDYGRGVEFGIIGDDGRVHGVEADSVPDYLRYGARLCPKCRRPLIWCTCDDLAELDDYAATVDAASYRGQ